MQHQVGAGAEIRVWATDAGSCRYFGSISPVFPLPAEGDTAVEAKETSNNTNFVGTTGYMWASHVLQTHTETGLLHLGTSRRDQIPHFSNLQSPILRHTLGVLVVAKFCTMLAPAWMCMFASSHIPTPRACTQVSAAAK